MKNVFRIQFESGILLDPVFVREISYYVDVENVYGKIVCLWKVKGYNTIEHLGVTHLYVANQ